MLFIGESISKLKHKKFTLYSSRIFFLNLDRFNIKIDPANYNTPISENNSVRIHRSVPPGIYRNLSGKINKIQAIILELSSNT